MKYEPSHRDAYAYATRGWPVLPLWQPAPGGRCGCGHSDCDNEGKHPIGSLVPHGLQDATTNAATVTAWWTAHPDANVGVRTGAESGVVVLDVDGREGQAALRELVEQHDRFDALWARTGSGGWHAYLAHPGGEVPNSVGRVGPGLDVRGDGGYVVAPPSQHASGGSYRWVNGLTGESPRPLVHRLPEMPAWLTELARPAIREEVQQPVRVRAGGESAYVAAAIDGETREVTATQQPGRNHRLYIAALKLGGYVGSSMASEHEVTSSLLDAARRAGLSDREAVATIRSGLRAGKDHPRAVELTTQDSQELSPDRSQEAEAC